ncbi:MAG TPA: acyl-CoA dehydrogenase family protein [Alphaproteobacteria bacterium]|jgi:alkylation response protein AidB-like acyl-CoA dehydrogenase
MPAVADMFSPLSASQRRFVDAVRALGPEFQQRGFAYDDEGRFPVENYADLKRTKLHAINVPGRYGGLGGSYTDYAVFSAELARWCGATALTFNMHAATVMWLSVIVDDFDLPAEAKKRHETRRARMYDKVVNEGAIFAQPFSEPNSAAAAGKSPFGTGAKRVDGGYLVNGMKHFASLSGYADYYAVVCTEEDKDGMHDVKNTILLAVPSKTNGVKLFGGWDVLGMRATDSRSLDFKDVFVPEDNLLMPPGIYYEAALKWPHMFVSLTPSYLGISQAAFDFTVGYLRGEVEGAPPAGGARHSAAKQMAVAEMRIKLEQAKALWWRVMHEARLSPPKEDRLRAYAAQYTVMEYANDLCRLAIRVCGGRSIFKNFLIERLYRDSRCGSLMLPWTAEICLERLGRESLFDPGEK